jgi:integrase
MSLYQRGKSWYYDFQYRGERYTGNIGPVSKTIAKEILAKKKAEAVEGRYELPSKKPSPRLGDFVEEYFAYYRANRRLRSVVRHETSWHAMQPVLGGKRLDEISPFDLERYRRQRKQDGRSDVTINRKLAFLRNLYSMALTWGKATENPVKKVRFARENNGRMRILTAEEEVCLLAHCSPHLRPVVIAALHTGFRKSELLSLTWGDVDFRRQLMTVQAAYAKNGESRSVPMNVVLTATLKAIRMNTAAESPVFCNRQGTPYRSFRTAFEQAVCQAGLKNFTFHDLRHTFASRLVMAGVDVPTVQALLGHKTITMTLWYTHLTSAHKRQAVQVLERSGHEVPAIFTTGQQATAGTSM